MKKQFFLFGAVAAFALGGALTACSDDALDEGNKNVAEVDQTRYMHVVIANPPSGGSRADNANFDPGTAQENYVHELYFVFYDAEGNVTGTPFIENFDPASEGNPGGTTPNSGFDPATGTHDPNSDAPGPGGNDGNIGKIWQSVIGVEIKQGQNLPSFVNVFVNPVNWAELRDKSLTELDKELRWSGQLTDHHFPMSNAVYYDDNPITGASMVRLNATPILAGQLYNNPDDAKANKALEVFVERYASKVSLTLKKENITVNSDTVNGYSLKFIPTYWRVNAVDRRSFVMKRFGIASDISLQSNEIIDYSPTYDEMNKAMGLDDATQWWNDKVNHRSYWGASPAYYMNNYPRVSDNITDSTVYGKPTGGYGVYYFSYKDIMQSAIEDQSTLDNNNTGEQAVVQKSITWNPDNGFDGLPFYANETTVASRAWGFGESGTGSATERDTTYNPLAALPSAVIVGHYEVIKDGKVLTLSDGFWLFGKTNNKWNLYESLDTIKKAMSEVQAVVLRDVAQEGSTFHDYRAVTVGNPIQSQNVAPELFRIEHPSEKVREIAKKTVAGRLETIQIDSTYLKANTSLKLYWYKSNSGEHGGYQLITPTNVDSVNAALLTTGYATHYGATSDKRTTGLAYFNIPIEHLGIYKTIATGSNIGTYVDGYKDSKTGLYNFNICPPGSFGLVRNHAYTINITGISGLGTALRNDEQPIVPPVDGVTYYISAKLNILNWRIVPTQTVTL